ncbi:TetR/AcrR family transcriptional regulator [Robbsia andropogonis]|uniref:TetR/AcrR family transcriptional regulator n=1 Tax=Robbsia andropogonis TaxID=28092 RepID=UPI0004639010|nr:TetR/AcrR family transcriptional regulator [Robbsia andropogonis]MCP1117571.1 TetR/AcrR family transcriptional regulator [Robbsia andropogonis]MCP1127037.1 TetR/AcrR family transcriptional regulator [Robbsia andropogonis]
MDRVSSDDSSRNTKARLLDAAEQLYTRSGPDSLSLRDLTEHAGVNLAAVNYHFGSKNALVCAMVARRLDVINELRLAELTRLESALGDQLSSEHVMTVLAKSLMQDTFDIIDSPDQRDFMIRVGTDLSQPLRQFLTQRYAHVESRFVAAFCRSTPWLDADTVRWHLNTLAFALPGVGLNANTMMMISQAVSEQGMSKVNTLWLLASTMRTLLGTRENLQDTAPQASVLDAVYPVAVPGQALVAA